MMRIRTVMGGLLVWGLLVAATYGSVHVVTTLVDENDGPTAGTGLSLREAIDGACPGDVIIFDAGLDDGTILLTLGELSVTTTLTIDGDVDGDGVADITLDGNDATRIINSNLDELDKRLRVQHLTFTRGFADEGGAIQQDGGELEVHRCNFFNNTATSNGGAIEKEFKFNIAGATRIVECVFELNNAGSQGGAIWLEATGDLQDRINNIIDGCIFRQNRAIDGGAVYHTGGFDDVVTCLIAGSLFTSNGSPSADGCGGAVAIDLAEARVERSSFRFNGNNVAEGGAVWVRNTNQPVNFDRCRFEENIAAQRGGGVFLSFSGTVGVDFRQCAFVSNRVESLGVGEGGGLYIEGPAAVRLLHSTFMNNFVTSDGFPVDGFSFYLSGPEPRLLLNHTVVGSAQPALNPPFLQVFGSFISAGYNMFSDATEPDAIATDITAGNNDSGLNPNNDVPGPNSDARNGGNPVAVAGQNEVPLTDIRGNVRIAENRIDIGPYEFGAAPAVGPSVISFMRLDPTTNGFGVVRFEVSFNAPIDADGVMPDDFVPVTTGTLRGVVVQEVEAAAPNTYVVTVSTGEGLGTLGLNLRDDDSIIDLNSRVPLGGVGDGNGDFNGVGVYQILPRGDLDRDGDVDADDWAAIDGCLAGPDIAVAGCPCRSSDVDLDSDVDITDLALLQQQI